MSDKQTLLKLVEAMPDGATWAEMTDRLLAAVARHGTPTDLARLYRMQLTAADLAEYLVHGHGRSFSVRFGCE